MGALGRLWDRFRGGGEAAVTVPPMDGALRPNQLLEKARAVLQAPAPDNLASNGTRIVFSSGSGLFELDAAAGAAAELRRFDQPISALAVAADGSVAVGLDDGRLSIIDASGKDAPLPLPGGQKCPTALLFTPGGALLVAQGSATRRPSEWKHDVMERGATGSVWRVDAEGGKATRIADGLAWPYGLALAGDAIAVSESWKHRVVLLGQGGVKPVLEDMPGYPARLAAAAGGGYWLAVFAPRNQLIEFVQREPEFRRRMMAEIEPDYWAAPSLIPSATFLEPLQGGAQKHLGMLKPWAPTRSYGLVVRLDAQFRPTASFHSRADGRRHGVTSCVDAGGRLLATAKGGDTIVEIDPAAPAPRMESAA